MQKFNKLLFSLVVLSCGAIFMNQAQAYTHEVRQSGSSYIWRVNNVDQGSTGDLATAIMNCMGSNREIHILAGGSLSRTIVVSAANVRLFCHNNTFTRNFSGWGIKNNHDGFQIHDMILRGGTNGYGIRSDGGSHIKFINVDIYDCPWIGIRVDSQENNPWESWVTDLEVRNCHFENIGSHGLETYSIDGVVVDNIVARNCGECGVLFNLSRNVTVGTVDAYRCNYQGGYAGLRFANDCSIATIQTLYARECGRGFFVTSGSNNIHLNYAEIRDCVDQWGTGRGIWLENVANCSVESGCNNSGTSVSGSGSYANVSSSCSGGGGGGGGGGSYIQLRNRGTNLYLDGMGRTGNGEACGQWANTTHVNSQWEQIDAGGGYFQLRNRGTGLYLDGMGRTNNGADCGQWASTTSQNSHWSVQQYSGSYYRIQNRATGLYLDGMGRTGNGNAAGQWANTTHNNAQWQVINVSGRLGGSEASEDLASDLKLFPNPVGQHESFTISLPETQDAVTMKVFDLGGKLLLSDQYQSVDKITVDSGLKAGVYMLHISVGNSMETHKLVVK